MLFIDMKTDFKRLNPKSPSRSWPEAIQLYADYTIAASHYIFTPQQYTLKSFASGLSWYQTKY